MTKLTVKDLNCGNCTIPHSITDGLSRYPHFFCGGEELPIKTYEVVCECGCARNPLALRVLTQGVAEELERLQGLMKEVLARPDPLALLEAWDHYNNRNFGKPHPVFADMIRLVREKPNDVRQHGIDGGWWKE